jgi:hypothetical protein
VPIPAGAKVYSIQIQAPGSGSPSEAVELAEKLGIHLWTAKNAAPGWVQEANRIARARQRQVEFSAAGEDYGTFLRVPGLGTYSHLIDWVAAEDPGPAMPRAKHPYSLGEVRDQRFAAIAKARGTLVWQFLENEELTRVLLDKGDWKAISTFHFGNENFLHSQPFLHRWLGRIPFVALQDAHAPESWWWGDMLAGFTTLYVATRSGWQGWLDAVERNHVMAVRHDAVTGWKTQQAGGSPELREFIGSREREWRWWDDAGRQSRRPAAAVTVLRPGAKFEAGAPESGAAVRVRLWGDNNGQAVPGEARAELISLAVDGREVQPKLVEAAKDRYYLAHVDGEGRAVATVRVLATGETRKVESV